MNRNPGPAQCSAQVGYGADGAVAGENSRPQVGGIRHDQPDRTQHSRAYAGGSPRHPPCALDVASADRHTHHRHAGNAR